MLAAVGQAAGVGLAVLERGFSQLAASLDLRIERRELHDGFVLCLGVRFKGQCAVDVILNLDVGVFYRVVPDQFLPVLLGRSMDRDRAQGNALTGHAGQ